MSTSQVPARILISDDEPIVAEVLHAVLKGFYPDVQIRVVTQNADAEAAVVDFRPDVVLLDTMQNPTSFEVARRLRPTNAAIRVIGMSGQSTKEFVREALACGMNAFMFKPYRIEHIREAITKPEFYTNLV